MTISTSNPETINESIAAAARALGFDAVGFAKADLPSTAKDRLMQFISARRHGDMAWMENRIDERAHPQSLWRESQSVIMLGMNYGPDEDPMAALNDRSKGVISVYAQNKDYHDTIKKRLKRLARAIVEEYGADVKVFVDTAPVMEKPLAALAGIGWQGKHTNLVSREYGSWLFLGAIFTTLALKSGAVEKDYCGSCRNCLDICPTGAFPAPYQLDARRCISYLTIEHKGPIPRGLRAGMGNRIYGCDDCLAVCPWNKFAQRASETAFHARTDLKTPALTELAALDDHSFRDRFSGSPIKRTGRDRFVRNVMIAIGNSKDETLAATAVDRLHDDSALVRGAAVWALSQLAPQQFVNLRKKYAPGEKDKTVLKEWNDGANS